MNLSQRDVGDIQKLLESSPYDELVVETQSQLLILRRTRGGNWVQELKTIAEPKLISGTKPGETDAGVAEGAAAEVKSGLVNVHPPLPGTFYRAPKPGAAPFVEIGSQVAEGTVIGIIETMKLMNPVSTGVAGEIAEICVANGTLVETSQVLMRVRPLQENY